MLRPPHSLIPSLVLAAATLAAPLVALTAPLP